MSLKIVVRKVKPEKVAEMIHDIAELLELGNYYEFIEVWPEEA